MAMPGPRLPKVFFWSYPTPEHENGKQLLLLDMPPACFECYMLSFIARFAPTDSTDPDSAPAFHGTRSFNYSHIILILSTTFPCFFLVTQPSQLQWQDVGESGVHIVFGLFMMVGWPHVTCSGHAIHYFLRLQLLWSIFQQ